MSYDCRVVGWSVLTRGLFELDELRGLCVTSSAPDYLVFVAVCLECEDVCGVRVNV